MNPTSDVASASPPLAVVSSRNGEAILTSCDSAKRNSRIKARAATMPGLWKKSINVSINAVGELWVVGGISVLGRGRMKWW